MYALQKSIFAPNLFGAKMHLVQKCIFATQRTKSIFAQLWLTKKKQVARGAQFFDHLAAEWPGYELGKKGLEPPTLRLSGVYSNLLSYMPCLFAL